jgi:filamentous hemagglutinin
MARQSGRTARASTPPIAAAASSRAGQLEVPHGFKSKGDFDEFSGKLYSGLEAAGHTDSKVFIRGSAASGASFKTGKPFDSGRRSDFDLAIVSPELFEKAKNLGIGVRQGASRTGPLNAKNLEDLGLTELVRGLAKQHGRKVSFMIYNSEAPMRSRGEAIELGRQKQEKGQ